MEQYVTTRMLVHQTQLAQMQYVLESIVYAQESVVMELLLKVNNAILQEAVAVPNVDLSHVHLYVDQLLVYAILKNIVQEIKPHVHQTSSKLDCVVTQP